MEVKSRLSSARKPMPDTLPDTYVFENRWIGSIYEEAALFTDCGTGWSFVYDTKHGNSFSYLTSYTNRELNEPIIKSLTFEFRGFPVSPKSKEDAEVNFEYCETFGIVPSFWQLYSLEGTSPWRR
jgi:hypothetical protein